MVQASVTTNSAGAPRDDPGAAARSGRRETQRDRRRLSRDRGAALVEFAIIAPMLFMLLFGIIDFGLMFGQKLDVIQGSREGARLASVNYQATADSSGSTQTSEIVAETCARMALADDSTVTITFAVGTDVGDTVSIVVRKPAQPVTGMFDEILDGVVLFSRVTVRLEQDASFAPVSEQGCP